MVPHGQIIKLKPGAKEPYVILHRNAFPGVVDRIKKSNLSHYCIFLHDDILFGYFEYSGNNYQPDLQAISDDACTQDWWKMTSPLQEPLPERKPGEWWCELELIYSFLPELTFYAGPTRRFAFLIPGGEKLQLADKNIIENEILNTNILKFQLFRRSGSFYLYIESTKDIPSGLIAGLLNRISGYTGPISEMAEVFHTSNITVKENRKKVFVTGCFDMLHSGHIEFLREAASFGDLYVCIGSDANILRLKGRPTVNTQDERKYMLSAVRHVYQCQINKGWGIMDFIDEIEDIRPDIFIVNEDGNTPAKADLCNRFGIEYVVLKRIPHAGLPARSTTSLRSECHIPFRIDLAGGWLDQPFVSHYFPGPVLTISIEPTLEFNDRSGMASSTRRKAIELWNTDIPPGNPENLAKLLFSYDNPPGTKDVSGSQDSLGIVLPGLNKLFYRGQYWPEQIIPVYDEGILTWLENHLQLVTLGPRQPGYDVVTKTFINRENAQNLSIAAEKCWDAILSKDIKGFGKAFRDAFDAQVSMFPNMIDPGISAVIEKYKQLAYGWKLSGAGGGGYLILVSDVPVDGTIRIKIRRNPGM